jgi:superfamily I DNA/RNA helicase
LPAVTLLAESGRMVWLPEIGLGIGSEQGIYDGWQREWVYWYDRSGKRYPTAQELVNLERQVRLEAEVIAEQEKLISQQERHEKEKLAAYLRSLGINPDEI